MFNEFIKSELIHIGIKNLANSIAEVFCVGVDTAMSEIEKYRKENK